VLSSLNQSASVPDGPAAGGGGERGSGSGFVVSECEGLGDGFWVGCGGGLNRPRKAGSS
jgi:hypothetical protein